MQLVIHSPYGGRINRAFGLALRKKFCRTFDFELQAAASDDAIVLSLGPHHSFPLDEVARYVKSHTVEETLQQAVLDAPMFISRWRWNLNRALLVLRFRGGRRNPPPIQRMEADDLMAAIFPQAAACQDNRVGPIEIPDHVIVRQTIDDTLHEALDVDGLRALLERDRERRRARAHASTRPSRRCSRTRSSPRGRTRSSTTRSSRTGARTRCSMRRGLTVDLAAIGQLDPDAIARVHEEITPQPETADDLHDLLCSLVLDAAAAGVGRAVVRARRTTAAARVVARRRTLWCATEMLADAQRIVAGDDDAAVARRARSPRAGRHHDRRRDRAARPVWRRRRVALRAGRAPERRASRCRAGTRPATDETRVGGAPAARAHALVLAATCRRSGVEPATAQDFMRFLLRWQHLAPGTQLAGDDGPRDGHRPAAGLGSRGRGVGAGAVRRAACATTTPAALDRLCHDGEVGWLRLSPRPRDADAPAGAPNKATPISVCSAHDLGWLLDAARDGHRSRRTDGRARPPRSSSVLRDARRVLRGRARRRDRPAARRHRARAVGRRRTWAAHAPTGSARSAPGSTRARAADRRARTVAADARRRGHAGAAAGRWSLVPAADARRSTATSSRRRSPSCSCSVGVSCSATSRCARSIRFPWRDVQRALRRLEDRGLVRGGRFVSGFSGEQFALPAAVEQLTHVRKLPRHR